MRSTDILIQWMSDMMRRRVGSPLADARGTKTGLSVHGMAIPVIPRLALSAPPQVRYVNSPGRSTASPG